MPDRRGGAATGLISAQEIACYAYCPEQWRLQYGLGLKPGNRAALDAGTRHHARKARIEQVAGGSMRLGWVLMALAALLALLAWVLSRGTGRKWASISCCLRKKGRE
jgi:hypothetical protein